MLNDAKECALCIINLIFKNETIYEEMIKKELEENKDGDVKRKESNLNLTRKVSIKSNQRMYVIYNFLVRLKVTLKRELQFMTIQI